jgi:hypothetical protein
MSHFVRNKKCYQIYISKVVKYVIRYIEVRGYIPISILKVEKENESDLHHPPVFYKF